MENLNNIIGIQKWFETTNEKSPWVSLGWETEDGDEIDEDEYELVEVIDSDKYAHPIKATFKKII